MTYFQLVEAMTYFQLGEVLGTYILITVVIGAAFVAGAWWAGRGD